MTRQEFVIWANDVFRYWPLNDWQLRDCDNQGWYHIIIKNIRDFNIDNLSQIIRLQHFKDKDFIYFDTSMLWFEVTNEDIFYNRLVIKIKENPNWKKLMGPSHYKFYKKVEK